jgi:hypothetical protein
MAAEAAVLGTPSLRFNDFVGRLSYLEELETKFGLTYGFKTDQHEELLLKIDELLEDSRLEETWKKRQRIMLEHCDDVHDIWINEIEKLS